MKNFWFIFMGASLFLYLCRVCFDLKEIDNVVIAIPILFGVLLFTIIFIYSLVINRKKEDN